MSEPLAISDSLTTLAGGMVGQGFGRTSQLAYGPTIISDLELTRAYETSWIARKIVDVPALDTFRKWRAWQAEAGQISAIEGEEVRLGAQVKMMECKTKARLGGAACLIIGDGAAKPDEPLNVDGMGKGGLAYLNVLLPRDLTPGPKIEDPTSPDFGKPEYYETMDAKGGLLRIHTSRVVVFIGVALAGQGVSTAAGFGGHSALAASYDAVRNADATAANIASLVMEANVDVFGVEGLTERIAGNSAYEAKVLARFALSALTKGATRTMVRDMTEQFDRKQISFGSLPEVMDKMLLMAAAAADIPLTRFLGSAPGGLSNEGSGEERAYFDRIGAMQSLEIQPAIWRLDECLIRSALGTRPPEIHYRWNPLRQTTEMERAEIGDKIADMVLKLTTAGHWVGTELRDAGANALIEAGSLPGLEAAMMETNAGGKVDLGGDDPVTATVQQGQSSVNDIIAAASATHD